jgi:hypothetical protein
LEIGGVEMNLSITLPYWWRIPAVGLVLALLVTSAAAVRDVDLDDVDEQDLRDPFKSEYHPSFPYYVAFLEHVQLSVDARELHMGVDVSTYGARRSVYSVAPRGAITGYGELGDSITMRYEISYDDSYWYVEYTHLDGINTENFDDLFGGQVKWYDEPIAYIDNDHLHIEVGISESDACAHMDDCDYVLNPSVYAFSRRSSWAEDWLNPVLDAVDYEPPEPSGHNWPMSLRYYLDVALRQGTGLAR